MQIDFTKLTEREKLIYNQALLNAQNALGIVRTLSHYKVSILTVNDCMKSIDELFKK